MLARSLKFLAGQVDELLLLVALGLLTVGLWAFVGQGALVAPGAALLWIGLPSRKSFIVKDEPGAHRPRKVA